MTNSRISDFRYSFSCNSQKYKDFIFFLRVIAAVTVLLILFQIIDIRKVNGELAQADWTWELASMKEAGGTEKIVAEVKGWILKGG